MYMMGIDLGTTNRKVGLFDPKGQVLAIASRPTVALETEEGYSVYDPEALWQDVVDMIKEVTSKANVSKVQVIGIASMAESGLLVHQDTGTIQSPLLPWFETRSTPQAEIIKQSDTPLALFQRTGLHLSFKHGLPKLLWLYERDREMFREAKWLSVSGFIAYRLSGVMAFDPTLATRTFAYDMRRDQWDTEWIREFGLPAEVFPDVLPSGAPLGKVKAELASELGLWEDTTVAIAGHDHVAASLAVGAVEPGEVFASMGTAETLVGMMKPRALGQAEFETGLSYGYHVIPGYQFWMGGNAASGGAVEWIRKQLGDDALTYEEVAKLLAEKEDAPSEVLFFPYLSGSGAPYPNSRTRASFIGLSYAHGKADLVKAVCEGTAYQLEMIKRSAEQVSGQPIHVIRAVGGGTRLKPWLQMKANAANVTLIVPPVEEATLQGAAYTALLGAGHLNDIKELKQLVEGRGV
ncbi:FGGY-family carbohydrate kinase, partial [Paenibacillus sp. 1001270B_150601_E10]|uniref:FGGY-family carbohydrate kinase n=1 Tax=Paenibacillus sp. 1001270B_150601_E10 TaxID=2787079 RepID=UPI001E2CF9E5